jgi:hypothetical protein
MQMLEIAGSAGADDTGGSLRLIQIKDSSGRVVWHKRITNPASGCQVLGTAYRIRGQSDSGLGVEYANVCRNRVSSGLLLLFYMKGSELEEFSDSIVFHGELELFPEVAPQRRRLGSGDLARYQDWVGYYYLIRAARINFRQGALSPWCVEKCMFPIMSPTVKASRDQSVPLSSSRDGETNMTKIKVGSRIRLLSAYVGHPKALDGTTFQAGVRSIQLSVNGRQFWADSDRVLQELGFPFRLRASMP